MLQNSQKKNQSPHSFGWGPPNGDFDFFGEFHGITPKTPMYIYSLCLMSKNICRYITSTTYYLLYIQTYI